MANRKNETMLGASQGMRLAEAMVDSGPRPSAMVLGTNTFLSQHNNHLDMVGNAVVRLETLFGRVMGEDFTPPPYDGTETSGGVDGRMRSALNYEAYLVSRLQIVAGRLEDFVNE